MHMQPQQPRRVPDWLYLAIVVALGSYFVVGGIAWTVFIFNGVAVPDAFTTILATIAGGLVGVLSPTGGKPASPSTEEPSPTEPR
jgi:hypothetical protein